MMQETMGEPYGIKERWELFKFNYITSRFQLTMLWRMASLLNPRFHPRKIRNVDQALVDYKYTVKEDWILKSS